MHRKALSVFAGKSPQIVRQKGMTFMSSTDKPFDISFHTEGGRFNFRVGAIIRHGGKMLLIKNRETTYLYTVGGRVRYNETTEEAVIREVKEETGITMEVERILFFMEQFFDEEVTGEHFHEIGVYYLMKDDEALENVTCESVTERGVMEELIWIPEDAPSTTISTQE